MGKWEIYLVQWKLYAKIFSVGTRRKAIWVSFSRWHAHHRTFSWRFRFHFQEKDIIACSIYSNSDNSVSESYDLRHVKLKPLRNQCFHLYYKMLPECLEKILRNAYTVVHGSGKQVFRLALIYLCSGSHTMCFFNYAGGSDCRCREISSCESRIRPAAVGAL